jgi:hypothetical protein
MMCFGACQAAGDKLQPFLCVTVCSDLAFSAEFRIYKLPQLAWFVHCGQQLAWMTLAIHMGHFTSFKLMAVPDGWLMASRKHLSSRTLKERTAINWDVPEADIKALLAGQVARLSSTVVYAAGTGFQLNLQRGATGAGAAGHTMFSIGLCAASYHQHGSLLCSAAEASCINGSISQQLEGKAEPHSLWRGTMTMSPGFSILEVIKAAAATPADLTPYLVGGCARFKADFMPILNASWLRRALQQATS